MHPRHEVHLTASIHQPGLSVSEGMAWCNALLYGTKQAFARHDGEESSFRKPGLGFLVSTAQQTA